MEMLKDTHEKMIANYTNAEWYESNMAQMMIFMAGQIPIHSTLVTGFLRKLKNLGVSYAADMVLIGEKTLGH
ncbi:MAG: hypothetical protein MZV70_42010 [Desulfobacterales bacterium]|nr:hypothetical protein [Desulfobacterales bacterium]